MPTPVTAAPRIGRSGRRYGDQLAGRDGRGEQSGHHRKQRQSRLRRRHPLDHLQIDGQEDDAPNMAMPMIAVKITVGVNTRLWNRRSGMIGSSARNSTKRNRPVSRTPPPSSKSENGSVQPYAGPAHAVNRRIDVTAATMVAAPR